MSEATTTTATTTNNIEKKQMDPCLEILFIDKSYN